MRIAADGASLDSEWNDTSRCECLICGWQGTLLQTRSRRTSDSRRTAAPPENAPVETRTAKGGIDLEQIRQRLAMASCPATWKPQVEALVAEVERLRGLIDVMARVSGGRRRSARSASDDDTVIG